MSNIDKNSIDEYKVWLEKINVSGKDSIKIITTMILEDFYGKKAELEQEYGVKYCVNIPKSYVGEQLYNWTQSEMKKIKRVIPLMRHGDDVFRIKLGMHEQYNQYFHEKTSKNILRYFFLDTVIKTHFEPYKIHSYSLKYNTPIVLFQLSVIFDLVYENDIPIRIKSEKAFSQLKKFITYDSTVDFLLLVCKQIEKKRRESQLLERLGEDNIDKKEKKKKI